MESAISHFITPALDRIGVSDEMRHLMITPYREVNLAPLGGLHNRHPAREGSH